MSRKRQSSREARRGPPNSAPAPDADVRIIGGEFRGRRLRYHGDPTVRPMKHRVREAIFNLVGADADGRLAIDLFAGTGALGLEALSRGAAHAILIEKHVPTARLIEENIRSLCVEERTTLRVTSAFLWAKRDLPTGLTAGGAGPQPPWLIFCSPPYAFFTERRDEMMVLLAAVKQHAPPGSALVVEADELFDFSSLAANLDVRQYPPAVVGIWRKPQD
jgi:16S rRNA (guanine(966)-N(2))-methyltransferase RsmD